MVPRPSRISLKDEKSVRRIFIGGKTQENASDAWGLGRGERGETASAPASVGPATRPAVADSSHWRSG